MTMDMLSVRQWQEQYRAGAFHSKDTTVQREAGWWHWCCRDDALAGRLRRIAPVVMGIKSPFVLDQCFVWFTNERTEHRLLYDSVRFEPLGGAGDGRFFMVDYNDPCQPDKWTLYTKRFGFHAPEFSCGHVHDMVEYIGTMVQELEQGIRPPFLDEKTAAVEYIMSRPVCLPSRALRREGDHSYSFLDRDDGRRKMVHVAHSLNDIPPDCEGPRTMKINGLYVCCPEDAGAPLPSQQRAEQRSHKKKGVER